MIRKMILPAITAVLLAGCASYQYRSGAGGDYYYGQPSADYQYYGSYYGAPYYGSPYGWGGSVGYSYGYYPYGGGYVRYPHYRGYPRYQHHDGHGHGHGSRPGTGTTPDAGNDNHRPPSWRDLGALRERARDERQQRQNPVVRGGPTVAPMERSAPVRRSTSVPRSAIRSSHSKRDQGRSSAP